MRKLFKLLNNIRKKDSGQGLVEYGLILALVSIVSIATLGVLGGAIKDNFEEVVTTIGGVTVQEEVVSQPVYTDEEIQDLVNQGYIEVATAEDLNNVRNNLNGKYIQVADIDLSGIENFEPIGKNRSEFTGTFDGGGYVISNLTISRGSEDNVGLFGWVNGATLKNIGLVNVNVTGRSFTGGLVGRQLRTSISNSYATGSVTSRNYSGGLVGYQSGSSVSNSYATGSVNGGSNTGGLVGYQYNSSTVTNSYATGSVTGKDYVGGLVGYQSRSSTVSNSYATGSVNGTGDSIGGLVGYQGNLSTVTNSYAAGSVTGGSNTGGLVGGQYEASVSNSYWDKDTTKQEASEGGTGKTTEEMKNKDTYADWDFESIWTIENNQYPTLR